MRIHFVCNVCGKKYVASVQQQGKSGECKACGHKIKVPILEAIDSDETQTEKGQHNSEILNASNHQKTQEPKASNLHSQPLTSGSLNSARALLRFIILAAFNLLTFFLCSSLVVLSNVIFPKERLIQIWITTFGYDESAKSLLFVVAGLIGIIRYGIPVFLWIKVFKWSKRKVKSVPFFNAARSETSQHTQYLF